MTTEEPINPDVIQYRAGNRALWSAAQKYLGVICGSILAVVLTDPSLARSITIISISGNILVESYLLAGIAGILIYEFRKAIAHELNVSVHPHPMWMKKALAIFGMIGMILFAKLLHELLNK